MLTEIASGVLVRQSAYCRTNSIVVLGPVGALLVDPGVDGADLADLADSLDELGETVYVGFATHPHWDHVLWHERFGDVPRYATAACAAVTDAHLGELRKAAAPLAPGAPLELLGAIAPLPEPRAVFLGPVPVWR